MSRRRPGGHGLALAAMTMLFGCGDVVVAAIGGASADAGSHDAAATGDASFHDAARPTESGRPDAASSNEAGTFCTGQGPISLGSGQCTGDVARLFRFAACACDSLAVSGLLETSAFGTSDAGTGSSASVAANGQVASNGQTTVRGSVWAGGQALPSGTPAVTLTSPSGSTSTVALDVESGGNVVTSGSVLVGRDVYANGDVAISAGALSVVGAVHVPSGDTATGVTSGGGVVDGPVTVAPPCDCASPVDIASVVADRAASNDDGMAGLASGAFENPASTISLPCGIYYFDEITGSTDVTLEVTGRAAIFVAGNVDTEGLTITLKDGAELDLFIVGDVTLRGSTSLNATSAPSNMRVYVGGTGFTLAATAEVNANVYAPNADVELASDFDMSGAFFAKSLQFSGSFRIEYDTSILDRPGCSPPGASCSTCNDCAGATPACRGGTCSACVTTADCCAPLECDPSSGRCEAPLQ